jgi:hypothetical protein
MIFPATEDAPAGFYLRRNKRKNLFPPPETFWTNPDLYERVTGLEMACGLDTKDEKPYLRAVFEL